MKPLAGHRLAACAHVLAVMITAMRLCVLLLPALLHYGSRRGLRLLLLATSLLHPAPALPQTPHKAALAIHVFASARRRQRRPQAARTTVLRPRTWPVSLPVCTAPAQRRSRRYRQPPAQAPPRVG